MYDRSATVCMSFALIALSVCFAVLRSGHVFALASDTVTCFTSQVITLFLRAGVGEVHDGLWAGLHQQDPSSPAGRLVVDRILDCLRDMSQQKQIFMCGHSLGGGLVTMLSLILPTRRVAFIPSSGDAVS